MKFYSYIRVSTEKQDIGRQLVALDEWKKSKNIENIDIFTDYYTGKTFDRENYQKLKEIIKPGDYLIVKEVDRLGRNWDLIKKEWQELKDNNINIIIIDMPILSDSLPGEPEPIQGLDMRFIKEQVLTLMCYSAQKERERISQRTKEGLEKVKRNGSKSGRKMGRPRNNKSNKSNFIKVLKMMINDNIGIDRATFRCMYPTSTFKRELKLLYIKYNTKNYEEILERLEKEVN